MTTSRIKQNNLLYYFFALLIVYLPFQRLLEQFFLYHNFSVSLAFWTVHWYEPLIVVALFLSFISAIRNKRFQNCNIWIIILSILFIIFSIISILFLSPTISRGMEGFRFSIFFMLAFLATYFSGFDPRQSRSLINVYLVMAGIFAAWGIIERFLPSHYLISWHLIGAQSNFDYGTYKVEMDVNRSSSGIGGPNQLASYLIPAFFITFKRLLILWGINRKSNKVADFPEISETKENLKFDRRWQIYYIFLMIASFVTIFYTFSRSAWVGVYVGCIITALILIRRNWLKIISIVVLAAVAVAFTFFMLRQPNNFMAHGESDTGHESAIKISLQEIKSRKNEPLKLIFGSGLGTAGPAVLKYGDGLISESWYLQLTLELGLLGLALWLVFIIVTLFAIFKKNTGVFIALFAVSVAAIFLHTFADNPALSITLFILIGVSLCQQSQKLQPN